MGILKAAAQVLWGVPMMAALLVTGLFFTCYLGAFQLRWPRRILRRTLGSLQRKGSGGAQDVTQLQSMCTALAATVGVGSISGVATAITLGGPGSVFWMWVTALLGMATGFAENVLGMRYRQRTPEGERLGGPMYYMARGLGMKGLGLVYAACCCIAALGVGCLVQSNSIAAGLKSEFSVPEQVTGPVLAALTAIVTLGGAKRIGRVTEALVPAMVALYVLAGLACLVLRAGALPGALAQIFHCAFTPRAAAGGGVFTLLQALRYGVSRGVFSNEAGLGSSVMAHTAAAGDEPVQQGFLSVVETGVDTLLLCTITALVILTSGVWDGSSTGTQLAAAAYSASLGPAGGKLVAVSLLLFAFSTVLGWSHYGACAVRYVLGRRAELPFRLCCLACVAVGGVLELDLVWLIVDVCNGLMAAPNLTALWLLRREVRQELRAFSARLASEKAAQQAS